MEHQKFLWITESTERYHAAMAYFWYFGVFLWWRSCSFENCRTHLKAYAIAILH